MWGKALARGSLAIALLALAACSPVEDPSLFPVFSPEDAKPVPHRERVAHNPDKTVFWGDLHIHTSLSTDAYTNGVRSTPDDAYTFTKGGEIPHSAGYGISLSKPLDFAAVTDHSEYLGVLQATDPDLPLKKRGLRKRLLHDGRLSNTLMIALTMIGFDLEDAAISGAEEISRSAWQQIIDTAERHNDPGLFTTFIGYEWSSMPEQRNLHRNVIYRSSAVPDIPYSSIDSEDPRDLWSALEQQRRDGMEVFAIPHNGNVSDGRMYDRVAFDGTAMDANYARQRMRNEPLSEIFQVKGSSETHPLLSARDEFAGFEIYDTMLARSQADSSAKGSYIRDALRVGMELSHTEGFNPYRFGVIGSSDGHNASSPVEENRYHGKLPLLDGSAALRLGAATYFPKSMAGGVRWSAAGLAAVWAEENTRESLFDAMRRKETYATSGPRITLRFFGGWNYPENLMQHHDWIGVAHATGVPMGGTLPAAGKEASGVDSPSVDSPSVDSPSVDSPNFAIWAMRDPDSGNLDRIQIIKGWIDTDGDSHEKIFNAAWSGERPPDPHSGLLPPVGSTVDITRATFTNTIGAEQLAAIWTDPEFNPEQEAFYYARAIEIPTPRWSTFDAIKLGITPPQPSTLQERAVSSAIWFRP